MNRLDKSELLFKVLAYTFVTFFAIICLYPFIYTVSAAISGIGAMESGQVILLPKEIQFDTLTYIFNDKKFWISYSNTLFYTIYGTSWGMAVSILGAYALSKKRLLFNRQFNFLLVFTMWFSAGMIPTFINLKTNGIVDRWGIVFAFGVQAFNVVLLRNYFSAIPKEIEEAAIIDGANEFQLLGKIYLPMSKAPLATVGLFYGLDRWNGYYWMRMLLEDWREHPLQVYLRWKMDDINNIISTGVWNYPYTGDSLMYALIVCSIIPIIIVYPYLQKYFARGVNLGGVKE
jgi:putative aldouronate transport system permease protein